jgi:beta-N-acetylhexosaminidase
MQPMKNFLCFIATLLTLGLAPGYAQFPLNAAQQAWVDQTLAHMTLEEKIGQVMFPVAAGLFTNRGSDAFEKIKANIQTYHVGGYHIEGDGGDPATAALLIKRMQELSKLPLLITADLEGGAGYQFEGATRFPRGMAIGATGNMQYAYDAATFTAQEAKAMGFSVNFYPVVDVNNNAQNPIINIRSFGADPQSVGEFGVAYVKGTQDHGIISTAKHFPGHGDTSVDSHLELPVLNFDRARLDRIELPPFEAAIKAGVDSVMTAHINSPQIEKTPGVPASLSYAVTTGLLRRDLGFRGLVFTDALPMHAITSSFGGDQAVVMAIRAGADVALEPVDVPKAFAALEAAVKGGQITEERLNESVRRLLSAKAWAGLSVQRSFDLNQLDAVVGSRAAADKSREIIEHAVTLVKDDKSVIPLKLAADEEVLLVNFVDTENPEYAWEFPGRTFHAEFMKRHPKTLYVAIGPAIPFGEADLIRQIAGRTRTVVVSCSIRIASYRASMGLSDVQESLLGTLTHHDGPFVFALFGSPYLLNSIPDLPSYALAYEFYPDAEAAMVRALFGEIPFQGKLPVAVGKFPIGFSLKK